MERKTSILLPIPYSIHPLINGFAIWPKSCPIADSRNPLYILTIDNKLTHDLHSANSAGIMRILLVYLGHRIPHPTHQVSNWTSQDHIATAFHFFKVNIEVAGLFSSIATLK